MAILHSTSHRLLVNPRPALCELIWPSESTCMHPTIRNHRLLDFARSSSPRKVCVSTIRKRSLQVAVAVGIGLCSNFEVTAARVQTDVPAASTGATIQCPSRDFAAFLESFAASSSIQSAFTRFPLKKLQLDHAAQPEPKPFSKWLRRTQVSFPILPLTASRSAQGLGLRIETGKAGKSSATLFKQDTGYLVNFHFKLRHCWELVEIEDWSI